MKKTLWVGVIGIVALAIALGWNYAINRDEAEPEPAPKAQVATATDTTAPTEAPAKTILPPSFDIVRINPEGDTVIAGRAEPGMAVTVLDGDREIGTVTADAQGEWVLLPKQPLPPGDRELSLIGKMPDGTTAESARVVVLVVPEPGKDIAGRASEGPAEALALAVPRAGKGETVVLQVPPTVKPEPAPAVTVKTEPVPPVIVKPDPAPPVVVKPEPAPAVTVTAEPPPPTASAPETPSSSVPPPPVRELGLSIIDYDELGRLVIVGRAEPGAQLLVYLTNRLIGTARADPKRSWRLSPEQPVEPGRYRLRVDDVAEGGEVLARIEVAFVRTAILGPLPRNKYAIVQPGNSLWRIARRTYGAGISYTVIYQANKDQILDPDLIYPGQVFKLPNSG